MSDCTPGTYPASASLSLGPGHYWRKVRPWPMNNAFLWQCEKCRKIEVALRGELAAQTPKPSFVAEEQQQAG